MKYTHINNIPRTFKSYKLKTNKKKVAGFVGFVGLALITPCTNWAIPVVMKTINKLDPLFFYK